VSSPESSDDEEEEQTPTKNRSLARKPGAVIRWEERLGRAVPFSPNLLSVAKLLLVTPAIVATLPGVGWLSPSRELLLFLFATFFALDYLDGVVARAKNLETRFGRIFDRATDYPLLLAVSAACVDIVPWPLLGAKLAVDGLLLVLYARGHGSTENRLRTGISYAALLALTLLSHGWAPRLVTPASIQALLGLNIAFSGIVAIHNLGLLQKRFIADAISGANLACGIASMYFAAQGKLGFSLLLLILGAAFDGFDGAAARRWGGTRWGVYSDDIADGVNYGIAPGYAIACTVAGLEGIVIGTAYSVFTISRLVFFTLNKAGSDPNYFAGVPSTVGGLITICSLILFRNQPSLLGMMVGIACMQMVAFSTHYRHLGRLVGQFPHTRKRAIKLAPLYLLLVFLGFGLWGINVPVSLILGANLAYGFAPTVLAFHGAITSKAPDEEH